MKKAVLAFAFTFHIVLAPALASEIAVIGGQPDTSLSFVKDLLHKTFLLGKERQDLQSTTIAFSILERKGVKSVSSIQVLDEEGSADWITAFNGFRLGAQQAPVVYTFLGPNEENICSELARYPGTVFVIPAGHGGTYLNPKDHPSCLAKNILKVTSLDQKKSELMFDANWGPLVRIASPSNGILGILPGGQATRHTDHLAGGARALVDSSE